MRVLQDIKPTAEQLVILRDTGPGFRLVRGAAGSGKTTVALMRLRQLWAARLARRRRLGSSELIRVLVLTFNTTLRGYVHHLAHEQIDGAEDVELTVDTVSRWARNLCDAPWEIVEQRPILRDLLSAAGMRADVEYFVDEVEYLLGRFAREEREAYVAAERSGRGRAPAGARLPGSPVLAGPEGARRRAGAFE